MTTDTKLRPGRIIAFVLLTLLALAVIYSLVFRIDFNATPGAKVRFDYVGTIQVGSPVRKSGVKVGSVGAVEINPQDQKSVIVTLALYQGHRIRQGDRISIASGGILGDQYIDIYPVHATARVLGPQEIIQGEPSLDLRTLVAGSEDLIRDLGVSSRVIASFLQRNGSTLDDVVKNVDSLTREAASAAHRLDGMLARNEARFDPALADLQQGLKNFRELSETTRNLLQTLKPTIQDLAAPNGLFPVLSQPQTAKSVHETLENLRAVTANLKSITESLEKSLR